MFDADGNTLMRFGGPGDAPGALGLPSSLAIDSTSIPYFRQYAHEAFDIAYLMFVVSQYGEHLVNVYAFGSFPPGFKLPEAQIGRLPAAPIREGIGPVQGAEPPPDRPPSDHHPQSEMDD
jgi:hypothetical protein